jgi:hypothetical protein
MDSFTVGVSLINLTVGVDLPADLRCGAFELESDVLDFDLWEEGIEPVDTGFGSFFVVITYTSDYGRRLTRNTEYDVYCKAFGEEEESEDWQVEMSRQRIRTVFWGPPLIDIRNVTSTAQTFTIEAVTDIPSMLTCVAVGMGGCDQMRDYGYEGYYGYNAYDGYNGYDGLVLILSQI